MSQQTATSAAIDLAGLSGQELARARRAMLAQVGKKGVAMLKGMSSTPMPERALPSQEASQAASTPAAHDPQAAQETEDQIIDTLCTVVEQDPAALGEDAASTRQYCRERRRAMSIYGKAALPGRTGGSGNGANGSKAGLSGREFARKRREEMSLKGRGDAPAGRPSGRVRPQAGEAPAKVETGTTLSGQTVTGTQVERTVRVTGAESGSCRTITGTEYIGSEQFDTFCATRPEPSHAKVGISSTSRGQQVSGTEIGRSSKVTGDEHGSCKPVTGSEYLGTEDFTTFCEGKGLRSGREKVSLGTTERKGISITGSDEARIRSVTGTEAGARKAITGSQYADAGASRLTINGPAKVALTHTLAGRPVSGTEVGHSVKVTGDEAGACRSVSGTEYLSNEQFQSICHTRPAATPDKVGVDASEGGQRITGNLVERTEKVTGNEPGACQRVTGAQYARGNVCGSAPAKAAVMHTLAGRALTGTALADSPKITGDEHGGCLPVTGTEYYGQEHYDAACPRAPSAIPMAAAKVGVSHTRHGLAVSGTPLGRASRVTGDEPGSRLAISGTPYAPSEQTGEGCGCRHADAADEAAPAMPPRFQAPGRPRSMAMSMIPADPRPESFSVSTPAHDARGRITGSGYGGAGRITGPVNMAAGLVSGTPEFRYRDEHGARHIMPASMQEPASPQRITGEGRDGGARITGDDWARSGRVTGTEGRWAQGRNLTLRGEGRSMGASARANKDLDRPEVPLAKVTGSSGNAGKGALITVSGGARG